MTWRQGAALHTSSVATSFLPRNLEVWDRDFGAPLLINQFEIPPSIEEAPQPGGPHKRLISLVGKFRSYGVPRLTSEIKGSFPVAPLTKLGAKKSLRN